MPLLLFTSRQDHVVEPARSEYLAEHYGGPVDHRWLERSYHVATQDYDRDAIFVGRSTFTERVTGRDGPGRASPARRRARSRSGRCRSTPTG